jgi:two-component system cell cycle response regulator
MLLVEDNPVDAKLVAAVLASDHANVEMEWVPDLHTALARLGELRFDVILLDLFLPDARGLEALQSVRAVAPSLPIVVLTGRNDQATALEAVRQGAQDYLAKERLDGELLLRSLRYAIERQRLVAAMRALSLTDHLTGLFNRRGFLEVAGQEIKILSRRREQFAVFYADLDGLKGINDRLGHQVGDRAIQEAAAVLRDSFCESDIKARIGGDEFAVLGVGVNDTDGAHTLLRRVHEEVARRNAERHRTYVLSLSVGLVNGGQTPSADIDWLVAYADAAMYDAKRMKKHWLGNEVAP